MNERAIIESEESEKYLRVASITLAMYDYILTLPAEWRFYRSRPSNFHLRLTLVLFILLRYSSILVMVLSNYGVFSTSFSPETCQRYYLVVPAFKAIQTMISQVILGVRTFNIARRDTRIGIALAILYFVSISVEWFSSMAHRQPVVLKGNCTPANTSKILTAWFYYLSSMLYDLVTLTISVVYLLQYNPLSSRLGRLVRVLIYDGIGYFIVLTFSNVFNIIIYRTAAIGTQSAGASLSYAVTWIMSQRILIHLRDLSEHETQRAESVVVVRPSQHSRNGLSAHHPRFDSKIPNNTGFVPASRGQASANDMELDIHVCVEELVSVDDVNMNGSRCSSLWGDRKMNPGLMLNV